MTPLPFNDRGNHPAAQGRRGAGGGVCAVILALAMLAGSTWLWRALAQREQERIQRMCQSEAEAAAQRLAAEMRRREVILRTLGREPQKIGDIYQVEHKSVDSPIAASMPGFVLLELANDRAALTRTFEKRLALRDPQSRTIPENLKKLFERPSSEDKRVRSAIVPLSEGGVGLVQVVFAADEEAGESVAALFRCHPMFHQALEGVAAGFDVTVFHDQTLAYRRGVGDGGAETVPTAEAEVPTSTGPWRVHVSPSAELASVLSTPLPIIAFGAGAGASLCLAGAVFYLGKANNQRRRLRAARDRLAENERRFVLALQSSADGFWEWRPQTDEVWYSDRFLALIGATAEEFPARLSSLNARVHPEDFETMRRAFRRHLEDGSSCEIEFRLLVGSGDYRWFRGRGQAMWDEAGRPIRMSGSIRDITDLKEAERALRERNSELSRKVHELEEFTYTISHDLKSPIVTILGYAGHLVRDLDTGRTDELGEYAGRISKAANRMKSNVDDLLELSRIGRSTARIGAVDLNKVMSELREEFEPQAQGADVSLVIEPDLPIVRADRQRVVQIIRNLLSNALQHGAAGTEPEIRIGARRSGEMVNIFVRDNGPGIPSEHHERIFGLFRSLSSDPGSTGVGLALVRRIAEAEGGEAWVESEPGRGAIFWVALPTPRRIALFNEQPLKIETFDESDARDEHDPAGAVSAG